MWVGVKTVKSGREAEGWWRFLLVMEVERGKPKLEGNLRCSSSADRAD